MSHPARASVSRLASLAAAVSLAGLSACAFGTYDPVATVEQLGMTEPAVISVTGDGSAVFTYETIDAAGVPTGAIKAVDAAEGFTLASKSLSDTAPMIRAFAPVSDQPAQVWSLDAAGLIERLAIDSSSGSVQTQEALWGPAERGVDYGYCDMDSSPSGVLYVTTLQQDGSFLYRRAPGEAWTLAAGPLEWADASGTPRAAKCARVSHDRVDTVILLAYDAVQVFVEDGDALSQQPTSFLEVLDETTLHFDLSAYAGVATVAGTDVLVSEGTGDPAGGLVLVDAYTGIVMDSVQMEDPRSVAFSIPADVLAESEGLGEARRTGDTTVLGEDRSGIWIYAAGLIDWQTKCEEPDTGNLMPDLCSYSLARIEFLQMDL